MRISKEEGGLSSQSLVLLFCRHNDAQIPAYVLLDDKPEFLC